MSSYLPTTQVFSTLNFLYGELVLFRDSRVAFTALWMFLVPENLEPKKTNFAEWDWRRVDLEFDHHGEFLPLPDNHFVYHGGETKFSGIGTALISYSK